MLLKFSSFISIRYVICFLCNYREEFVLKTIRSQFNIVLGCNLSFIRYLNASHLELDGQWMDRLHAIKEFATSFSSLILHAANLWL